VWEAYRKNKIGGICVGDLGGGGGGGGGGGI
jgi:hypothetical protein